jgi:hypothetical protein
MFAFAFTQLIHGNGKEQADMATSNCTHGAAFTQGAQQHTAAHDKLSSRVEALGQRLARYGLVVVVAWIGWSLGEAWQASDRARV